MAWKHKRNGGFVKYEEALLVHRGKKVFSLLEGIEEVGDYCHEVAAHSYYR